MTISVAAQAGDDDTAAPAAPVAFEEVYRAHAGSVHRFCLSQVLDRAAAEDLTHETFVRAFVVYEGIAPDLASARAWLLAIARNVCADHHRRGGRLRRLLARLTDRPPARIDVEAVAQDHVELARVAAALATFRDVERQVIGLRVAAHRRRPDLAGRRRRHDLEVHRWREHARGRHGDYVHERRTRRGHLRSVSIA
ncbi:MAG TPA: sigma-70 family RNA polymerase sigma factor [Candidatus Dormibacteraeota bacterium]|nr:sigma-70 family RNA polymerase sigma factor [Candidatus Dormibacteraeota bacterium]